MHVMDKLIKIIFGHISNYKSLFCTIRKSGFPSIYFYCDGIQSTTTSKRATAVTRYTHYVL